MMTEKLRLERLANRANSMRPEDVEARSAEEERIRDEVAALLASDGKTPPLKAPAKGGSGSS